MAIQTAGLEAGQKMGQAGMTYKMETVSVSVLMTAFNREVFIAAAIESVLASTFTDFELLVVDDASTDSTVAIARRYEIDHRVKVFQNRANLGQFANRNRVASLAKGEYLKFLDSDDLIYPNSLEIMVGAMKKFPEAGIAVCEKYRDLGRPFPFCLSSKEALEWHYQQHELLMIGPSGTIIKKEAFESVGGFEDFGMPSDNHLTLKIAARYPVVMLPRDLFWWRQHRGQVFTQTVNDHQNILANFRFNADILDNHSPLEQTINRQIKNKFKKIFLSNLAKLVYKRHKPLAALALWKKYQEQNNRGKKA